jgi:regulator of replication initiation timing
MSSSTKLTILQRGILQKAATIFVYFVSIAVGAFILDWADKRLFINTIQEAKRLEIITPEAFAGLQSHIESRDATTIFTIILIGLFCAVLGWFLMRWVAKRNWSWPVTLAKAVEFRSAMEQLGLIEPGERIDFVRKHRLPIFIAFSPFVGKEQEAVHAKLYAFAHDRSLGDLDVFERHIGKQTLCLDAADYQRLLQENGQKTNLAYSTRIVALEQEITVLTGANSLHITTIAKLTEENEKLLMENADLRQKLQTVPGREGKADTSTIRRAPFWRVAGPLINRLINEAAPGIQYSRPDIQAAFDAEVAKFSDLQAAIAKELHLYKQKEPESEFDLTGWGMDSIRAALGELAKKDPGATKKH